MKTSRTCPKCGSYDILRVPGKSGAYGVGNNIQMGMTYFSAVLVHRYVCCKCGFGGMDRPIRPGTAERAVWLKVRKDC